MSVSWTLIDRWQNQAIEAMMPALSPTMEEGTLAKWLVKEGDEFRRVLAMIDEKLKDEIRDLTAEDEEAEFEQMLAEAAAEDADTTGLRASRSSLSAENRRMMVVPKGFGHGFITLADDTEALTLDTVVLDEWLGPSLRFVAGSGTLTRLA